MLIDPFTGEVIDPADLPRLEDAEYRLTKYLSALGALYGVRRELRTAISSRRKAARLPPPRFRTEVQQRVAECPACGGRRFEGDVIVDRVGAEASPFPAGDDV